MLKTNKPAAAQRLQNQGREARQIEPPSIVDAAQNGSNNHGAEADPAIGGQPSNNPDGTCDSPPTEIAQVASRGSATALCGS